MIRSAKAHWQGNLQDGKGTLSTRSGVLDKTNYSFKLAFEDDETGTNPEELLAASLAGCFTMTVDSILSERGLNPTTLETLATLTMDETEIISIHLSIMGVVPNISAENFNAISKEAEKNCIIAKVLNVTITSESILMIEEVSVLEVH